LIRTRADNGVCGRAHANCAQVNERGLETIAELGHLPLEPLHPAPTEPSDHGNDENEDE
jgi:hypothetical protein